MKLSHLLFAFAMVMFGMGGWALATDSPPVDQQPFYVRYWMQIIIFILLASIGFVQMEDGHNGAALVFFFIALCYAFYSYLHP